LYGFCGGGLNQLYDEVIRLRMQAESGQLSHQIATQKIDSLFVDFKKYMLNRIQLKIFGLVIPSKDGVALQRYQY
jgi:hypothetical protein